MENQQNPQISQNMPQVSQAPVATGPSPVATPPPNIPPAVTKKKLPLKLIAIIVIVLTLILGGLFLVSFLTNRSETSGPADLVWWGLWEDDQAVSALISEYEQSHPNVHITYERQKPQDYRERLINSLAQGKGPDIFRIHNSWVPMFKNYLASLPENIMSAAEYKQTFYPVATSDFTDLKTGNLLAIPLEVDTIGLFINEDIFDTNLKSVPTTWEELLNTATDLTIKDNDGILRQSGAALGRTENVDHWQEILAMIMLQNNVKLANPTGEQAEQVLDYFTRFSKRGIWNATLPNSTQAFANGLVAMYFGPSWRVHEIRQMAPSLRFKVVPVPQLPKQTPNQSDATYATYWAEGVWAESKGSQSAWEFLKFMSSQASLEKFYKSVQATREFGEPYPRIDMQQLLLGSPYVGAFVAQAPDARSWYLMSRTYDGPTGINSKISKYFEDAVNKVNSGGEISSSLQTAASGVKDVLTDYGISTK